MSSDAEESEAPEVTDVAASNRFEARIGGELAGFATYERRGDRVILPHTEVDPRFEGQGVGSALAKGSLEQIRSRGERVVPLCDFIAGYIERHEAYADLVDQDLWAELRGS